MASTIVTPQNFIPSEQLLYTKPKVNASGGKSVGIINSSTRRSLMISTPLMLNWGVNVFEKEGGNAYSISLQFPREEFSNDSINEFQNMLESMESQIKSDALKHSRDWFGKQMTKDGIDLIWNPILKHPKDKETGEADKSRPPTLKVKLPFWEGDAKFELFDVNNELLIPNEDNTSPEAFITKASNIACIIQCGGIWFANNNFGVSWKLYQGVVKQTETLKQGVCHISLSEKDKEEMKNNNSNEEQSVENNVNVESDDEGEEVQENSSDSGSVNQDEEEVVPEPEPEKPKKKRVVKKKSS